MCGNVVLNNVSYHVATPGSIYTTMHVDGEPMWGWAYTERVFSGYSMYSPVGRNELATEAEARAWLESMYILREAG